MNIQSNMFVELCFLSRSVAVDSVHPNMAWMFWCIDLYCEPNEQMFFVHVTEALRFGQSTQALSVGNLTLALSLCPVSKASWRMIGLFDNKV